jgi:phosphatidylinositol glycan class T
MYSAPEWSFRQASGSLRYGMLPREAVCTENLTPWLKLLPCRDNAGLSALMDRPSIYTSFYHSQRLHLTSNSSDLEGLNGIVLEQTLTVVLHPSSQRTSLTHISESYLQPSWSLSSIFGRKVNGRCALAKSSKVYLQLERGLVSELEKNIGSEGYDVEANFELSVNPDRVLKEENSRHGIGSSLLYEFSVDKYSNSKPFDLGLTWKFPVIWSCQQAPLHAIRFLMGSGNERGAIAILLKSTDLNDSSPGADSASDGCELHVNIFQIVPWYIRVYYHSLQLFVDDQLKAVGAFVEKIHVIPSKDKISPGMMEMVLKLPCGVKSAALTLDFDKVCVTLHVFKFDLEL